MKFPILNELNFEALSHIHIHTRKQKKINIKNKIKIFVVIGFIFSTKNKLKDFRS